MSTWAVIMAGGSGTRFWPLSRKKQPKQFLPLGGGDSLLGATVARIAPIVPLDHVLVVTHKRLLAATKKALPLLPAENILAEPAGRNTAPCIAWAAAHAHRADPEALIAVLPADHHIADEGAFLGVLRTAIGAAATGTLVTVGIHPTRPETGYGYIETGEALAGSPGAHRVLRFVEKPDLARAIEFLAAGTFLWNSGMFFFRADAILAAIATHVPALARLCQAPDDASARKLYAKLPSISIDHGVMERAERVAVVPGSFGWSDVGSWTSAWELAAKQRGDNAVPEDAVLADASGNYVRVPPGKIVALIGVRDLVVVDTKDALLVVPRDRAQDVRHIVQTLEARGDKKHT